MQGVHKALQRRKQLSWAFNDKHIPSVHHPNGSDVGICGQERVLPNTGSISLPQEQGRGQPEGRARAVVGQPPGADPSRVTSPSPRSPLPWLLAFPQCPGWGWALVQALPLAPRRGLQTMLPTWAPPSPTPSASSSPGRRAGSPRVHLARVPAAARRAASSEMLRLG